MPGAVADAARVAAGFVRSAAGSLCGGRAEVPQSELLPPGSSLSDADSFEPHAASNQEGAASSSAAGTNPFESFHPLSVAERRAALDQVCTLASHIPQVICLAEAPTLEISAAVKGFNDALSSIEASQSSNPPLALHQMLARCDVFFEAARNLSDVAGQWSSGVALPPAFLFGEDSFLTSVQSMQAVANACVIDLSSQSLSSPAASTPVVDASRAPRPLPLPNGFDLTTSVVWPGRDIESWGEPGGAVAEAKRDTLGELESQPASDDALYTSVAQTVLDQLPQSDRLSQNEVKAIVKLIAQTQPDELLAQEKVEGQFQFKPEANGSRYLLRSDAKEWLAKTTKVLLESGIVKTAAELKTLLVKAHFLDFCSATAVGTLANFSTFFPASLLAAGMTAEQGSAMAGQSIGLVFAAAYIQASLAPWVGPEGVTRGIGPHYVQSVARPDAQACNLQGVVAELATAASTFPFLVIEQHVNDLAPVTSWGGKALVRGELNLVAGGASAGTARLIDTFLGQHQTKHAWLNGDNPAKMKEELAKLDQWTVLKPLRTVAQFLRNFPGARAAPRTMAGMVARTSTFFSMIVWRAVGRPNVTGPLLMFWRGVNDHVNERVNKWAYTGVQASCPCGSVRPPKQS